MAITLDGTTGINTSGTLVATGSLTTSSSLTTGTGAVYNGLQASTSQSMVGTNIPFTGIPSWVKRITVMTIGANTSPTVRLGTSGGIVATGYTSAVYSALSGNQTSAGTSTTEFTTQGNDGAFIISNVTGNTWIATGTHANSGNRGSISSGYIALSSVLTQLQITGTYTSGTVNIIYE
jgi:hypothetical protein